MYFSLLFLSSDRIFEWLNLDIHYTRHRETALLSINGFLDVYVLRLQYVLEGWSK
jgi:hypothetical protein